MTNSFAPSEYCPGSALIGEHFPQEVRLARTCIILTEYGHSLRSEGILSLEATTHLEYSSANVIHLILLTPTSDPELQKCSRHICGRHLKHNFRHHELSSKGEKTHPLNTVK